MFSWQKTSAPAQLSLQENLPGHADAWEELWLKQQKHQRYVSWGRSVYNVWFERALRPHLSPSMNMVELGCGTASLGIRLATFIQTYTGIDSSRTAISTAREAAQEKHANNATFLEADIFDDRVLKQYDFVWSQGLVEHFRDPARIIQRHLEFCTPGGKVFFALPARYSYHHAWFKADQLPMLKGVWPWTPQVFYKKAQLLEFVRSIEQPTWKNVEVSALQPYGSGILLVAIQL